MKRQSLASLTLQLLPLTWTLTAQTVLAQSQYAANVLSDRPVAYYRLGEGPGSTVAVDSSGNAHNGTYEPSLVLGVPGLIVDPGNTAVNFANGGDVVIPDAADLNFVNAPFTIEAWVNGTLSVPINRRVFDKIVASTPNGYGLDITSSGVRLLGCSDFGPPIALSDDTSYHIIGVSDGAGVGSIYVNGLLVIWGPFIGWSAYTGPAHIAVANDGSAQFDGVIDEVAVYNYSLTPSRVLAHYEAGINFLVPAPRLLTFPVQPVGTTSAVKYVKLTNVGSTAVKFTVNVTGAFRVPSGNCGTSLAAGACLPHSRGVYADGDGRAHGLGRDQLQRSRQPSICKTDRNGRVRSKAQQVARVPPPAPPFILQTALR